MRLDPGLLNNFGWGAVGLAALWIVLKLKPWRNGQKAKKEDSGALSPEEWEGRIVRLMRQANDEQLEKFRDVLRNELQARKR